MKKLNRYIADRFGIRLVKQRERPSVHFAKCLGNDLICIEVGVKEGENALRILKTLDIWRLYLIDPIFNSKAHKRLKPFGDRVVWLNMTSDKAIKHIFEEVDFIYIDGDHSYEQVNKDMKNYYKILKTKGILAGHDIDHEGVSKAFCEFVYKNKIQPFIHSPDWWIRKEKK